MNNKNWWQGAVIYQIYPRSFFDTNDDGIGDLHGITQKLDYIARLNVDAIWISPFFKSPMKDFGYDVSDYRDIDPLFGSLSDFDELIDKAHCLNIKVIIDLVLSHTSDQHPWFHDESKKNYYVWAEPKYNDKGMIEPPNNWVSVFGGSAWEWSDKYKQYYLHNFLKEQPDLNFHNKDVQAQMLDICKFWFERGVDGLRLDVCNFYFHDKKLRDNPTRNCDGKFATQFEGETPYSMQWHIYDKSRPENLAFIEKLRELSDSYDNKVLIGEIGDDHPYRLSKQYINGNKRLHTCYNPQMMSGTQKDLTEDIIRQPIEEFFNLESNNLAKSDFKESANYLQEYPSWAFSNHDVVRAASRWFKPYKHDPDFSKMLIALLGCLPGTIFLYQGEELGLPEAKIPFEDLQDPWAKETWPIWQGRDGCRTPLPWDSSKFCGFSKTKPWLPISNNHGELNILSQNISELSVLNFTRKFLKWRSNSPNLLKGNFKFICTNDCKIIKISRKLNKNETACIFNLSDQNKIINGEKFSKFGFKISGFN